MLLLLKKGEKKSQKSTDSVMLHLNSTLSQSMVKMCFYYSCDRAMDTQVCCFHSQALIKLLLEKMKRVTKSSFHICREVPFTQYKETGKRKRKAEEDSDINDTTFHSNCHNLAPSYLKKKITRAVGQI